ncbi:MAG: replication-relaxation family protein [Frankia sp.]
MVQRTDHQQRPASRARHRVRLPPPARNPARYKVEPDGYGLWADGGARVGFLLEHDTGTETVGRLVEKLAGYDARPLGMVVLFHLPSTARETHLHRLARRPRRWPVATTAADLVAASPHGLGGPVWLPLGAPDRRRLIDLATPRTDKTLWVWGTDARSPLPAPHLPLVG